MKFDPRICIHFIVPTHRGTNVSYEDLRFTIFSFVCHRNVNSGRTPQGTMKGSRGRNCKFSVSTCLFPCPFPKRSSSISFLLYHFDKIVNNIFRVASELSFIIRNQCVPFTIRIGQFRIPHPSKRTSQGPTHISKVQSFIDRKHPKQINRRDGSVSQKQILPNLF